MIDHTPASVPMVHRFLLFGLAGISVTFTGMMAIGVGPLIRDADDFRTTMAYAMAGLAAVIVTFGLVVLKPRVPERRPGQSVDQYWTDAHVVPKAMLVWF